jgi:hypothetical protein
VLEIATNGLLSASRRSPRSAGWSGSTGDGSRTTPGPRGPDRPGGFVLGRGAAYNTSNSIVSDDGEVVKVDI